MRASSILVALLALSVAYAPANVQARGIGGGTDCAVCTLIVALVSQTKQIKNVTAADAAQLICSYLPYKLVDGGCDILMDLVIPFVAPLIDKGETPDAVCTALKMCDGTCHLFPVTQYGGESGFTAKFLELPQFPTNLQKFNICTIVPAVCSMIDHKPFFDTDQDDFSTYETLRGSYWRGKDCDDLDATIFPGRDSKDALLDSNCNGIYGVDSTTGKTYEELYCEGTGAMGVASLGDSATAHFRLPADYLTARRLNPETYKHVLRLIENEADWPMLSWSTGHLNASQFSPDIRGPVGSIYSKLNERNRCNHRDFQNVGVNGARVKQLNRFETVLNRNGSAPATAKVKPILVVMSMIGNDVCGGHHGFSEMTTPAKYYEEVMTAVRSADNLLPKGSHVLLVPLVDGRILYDTMHARIHPIGSTNNDVTYTALYDYLNCLHISPCWGWMNGNETVRNMTTEIAMALGAQLPKVVAATKNQLKNIQVHFLGNLIDDGLKKFPGPKWELIEPVDGFHPSQTGNALLGEYIFNETLAAGILPPVNPNNDAIIAMFGDQGGY